MYKQIIIARKDLGMSPGKLAAQVAHASMAFLTSQIKEKAIKTWKQETLQSYLDSLFGDEIKTQKNNLPTLIYKATLEFDHNLYEGWIEGVFTKCVLQAKDRNSLLKAIEKAKSEGMQEGKDFFLIKDNCYTELEPEEIDENGVGRTLTCIGFRPMDETEIDKVTKRYQLYR